MEGLTSGWILSNISGKYHYIRRDTNRDDITTSPCGFRTRKFSEILKKFEILDVLLICEKCERKIKQYQANNKKKYDISNFTTVPTNSKNSHVLQNVVCAESGCNVTGVAFVSTEFEEKPHYCITHNLRVQINIQKEMEILA